MSCIQRAGRIGSYSTLPAVIALGILLTCASVAQATTFYSDASGNWATTNGTVWYGTTSYPGSANTSDTAYIGDGATVTLNSNIPYTVTSMYVGQNTGTYSGSGTLTMSGGSVTITNAYIGASIASGTVNQSAGLASIGTLTFGGATSGWVGGTYNLTGGTLAVGTGGIVQGTYGAATFNLGGGTLLASGAFSSSVGMALTSATKSTIDVQGNAVTLSGALSSSGSLTVGTGSTTGTLTLSGTNTYTGNTTVNGGVLAFSADANLGTAPGSATAGDLVINGGALSVGNVTFSLSSNRGIALGPASGSGSGTIKMGNALGGALTYGGIMANNSSGTGSLIVNGGSNGTLILTGANTYSGGTTISAGALQLGNGGATGSVTGAITDNTQLKLNYNTSVTVSNVITGTGTVTLTAGSVTLSGSNSYASTTVNGGQLTIGNTLTNTGALSVNAGTVSQPGSTASFASATIGSSGGPGYYLQGGGNLSVSGNLSVGGSNAGNYTQSGGTNAVSGVEIVGASTNSNTNTYTLSSGSNSVGTLQLGNGSSGIGQSGYYYLNGGTLAVGSGGITAPSSSSNGTYHDYLNFGGGVLMANSGFTAAATSGSLTMSLSSGNSTINTQSYAVTFPGVLGGGGALTVTGTTGTLTLSGANTYTGGTTLSAGQLNVNNATALGGAAGAFTISGGVIDCTQSGGITLSNNNPQNWNGSFTFTGSNALNLGTGAVTLGASPTVTVNGSTLTVGGAIGGSSYGVTKAGSGTLLLTGANTYGGATTISAGTLQLGAGGTTGSLSGAITDNATLAFNYSNSTTVSNAISGTGGVTLSAGSVTLNAANSYGATTVNAGQLTIGNTLTNSGALTVTSGTVSQSGYAVSAASAVVGNLSNGYYLQSGGTNTVSGAESINIGATSGQSGTGTYTLSGGLNSVNGIVFGANNPWQTGTGTYNLNGGTLALGTGSITTYSPTEQGSPTWKLNLGGGTLQATGSYTIGAGSYFTMALTAGGSTIDTQGNALTISAPISGAYSLNKVGSGTLTLSAGNSFSGPMTIGNGTLALSSSASNDNIGSSPKISISSGAFLNVSGISTSGGFQLTSGQTLVGTGTVTGGMTALSGSTVSPADAGTVGTLSTNALTFYGGSTLAVDLGAPGTSHSSPGSSDLLADTSTLTLGGTLALNSNVGGTTGPGSYQIATESGSASGSFASVTGVPASLHANVNTATSGSVFLDLYRLAAANTITPSTVNLGKIHAGGSFTPSALTVQNTASADGYSENLDASVGGTTGSGTGSGSISLLSAGSTNNTSMTVGISDNTAGAKSGTVTVNLSSDGSGTSGAGTTSLSGQTITVSGTVYRLAAANSITTPISLANIHVGSAFGTSVLSISNTATNDGYSECLDAGFGSVTGSASDNSGTISVLAAGGANSTAMTVGLGSTQGTAGSISGTVLVNLTSDGSGTSGLGTSGLSGQTVTISGKVYRLAAANSISTPISLANIHVGSAFGTSALSISNTATADGYSEGLDAGFGSVTGSASDNSGSISVLAAGGANSTSMTVGLGGTQGTAGSISGTVLVNLTSDGSGTSGLGTSGLSGQTVTISGKVYRLAAANSISTPISLGNVHVGSAFGTSALSISNTATNDGYSEGLDAGFGSVTGSASDNSGTISVLAAGGANSTAMTVGLGGTQGTAGSISGTVLVNLTSDGSGTSGLGTSGLSGQTVTISGKVYRLAAANSISTPISLGNVHVGSAFGTSALSISNTATNDGYSEGLDAGFGSVTGSASDNSGAISVLAAGGANGTSMTVGLGGTQGTAGSISGTVLVNLTSDGSGTSGLGTSGLSGQTVTISGKVYRLAAANSISTPISLGNIHVGSAFGTSALSISNTATNDGYSEGLDAGFGSVSGSASDNSGTISTLAAGGANSTSMTVGLGGTQGTAGSISGTVLVNLTSDGSGTSGLGTSGLSGQTVTISGKVYRLAAANSISTPISLGNIHVGSAFGTSALSISNTATADGYSEGLDAGFGSVTGSASDNSGSISVLAAGGANGTAMTVGLGGTQGTAGSISGTVLVNLTSDGSGTSGLGTSGLSGQTVTISGKVYRLAAANSISTPISLGNIHVGSAFGTSALSIQNTATNDGYSEGLDAGFGSVTGAASDNSGTISVLAAGGANSTAMTVGLGGTQGTAGSISGTVLVNLTSDGSGTSGLGTSGLSGQTVTISGKVYRLAAANSISTPISLGNIHVGSAFGTSALSIQNTATNDGYSEGLDAGFGSVTGAASDNSGTISVLAAGGANSTAMTVGLGGTQGTAGSISGTVLVNLTSDGSGTSGLGTSGLSGQTVTISGKVYRLAAANSISTPISLGNIHVGSAFGTSALSIQNTATNDGYSEGLDAGFGSVTGAASDNSGTISVLAAGGANSTAMTVGLGGTQGTAGSISGTVLVNLTSDGSGTSGLGTSGLSGQTVTISGKVYRLAAADSITTPISLGTIITGGTFGTQTLTVQNTAINDVYSEMLDASFSGTAGNATASGAFNLLSAGSTSSALTVGLTYAGTGFQSGTATIALVSDGNGTSGLGTTALGSQTVSVSGTVLGHAGPALTVVGGNSQTVIVGASGITAGLSLTNGTTSQTGLAALDVNSLGSGLSGPIGAGLVASGGAQSYTAALSAATLGTQIESFSLNAGDDHTLAGHSAAQNYSAGVTLNVLGHAAPAMTVVSGNWQTVIVGASGLTAGLSLTNGTTSQTGLAALDVNSIGSGLSGSIGAGLVASGGAQSYTATLDASVVGRNVENFSLNAGDDHTLAGHSAPQDYSTGVTLNVLGHAGAKLTVTPPIIQPYVSYPCDSTQTVIVGATGVTAGLTLANGALGETDLAALDVNSLGAGVTGSIGNKLVASGGTQSYSAALDTSVLGTQVQNFSLNAGDDHTLAGHSAPQDYSVGVTLDVQDHSNASLASGANQSLQVINFGNLLKGATVADQSFTIYNRAANTTADQTASMKLTGFSAAGDAAFGASLSTFSGLAAGSGTTYTASLDASNYTATGSKTLSMSASQLVDDSALPGAGGNNNGALSVVLQGNVGNATADASNSVAAFGTALTASVAVGGSYAGLESTATATSGSGGASLVGSRATILTGAASSSSSTVSMAWRTRTNAEATQAGGLIGDVVDLTGIASNGTGSHDGSRQTDVFVLEMSYSPDELQRLFGLTVAEAVAQNRLYLGYLDLGADGIAGTADDSWVPAVDGNFGGTPNFVGDQAFSSDYLVLGDYGVDTADNLVWAVVNHNSQFAANTQVAAVPEPSALVLLGMAAMGLLVYSIRQYRTRVRSFLAE